MAVCEAKMVAQRTTWDFQPRSFSFGGFSIDVTKKLTRNALPYADRVCKNIIWKTGAGDASHCLQKIIESKYPDCGTKYITFNRNGGGCACYPPTQTTCSQTSAQSGRQTYELEVDPSYNPSATNKPSEKPNTNTNTNTNANGDPVTTAPATDGGQS